MHRVARILLGIVLVAMVLAIIAIGVLTQTDVGRRQVRSLALDLLRDRVAGLVHVGRIDGNLLGDFSAGPIVISDSARDPFLVIDRVRANLDLSALLSQRIRLSSLALVDPLVVLARAPDGEWNFERIFPTAPDTAPDTTRGFGDWITLLGVEIVSGRLLVRQPWSPDTSLSPARRDSARAAALSGATRVRLERAGGHVVQVMDFRSIDAKIPWVFVANPDSDAVSLRVSRLDMVAEPFRPPAAHVAGLRATIRIGGDTVLVRNATVALPSSRITGSAAYLTDAGAIELDLHGDTIAFADLRWLYPRLPSEGGGTLDLDATIGGNAGSAYHVRDARLRHRDTRVMGRLGLVLGDTVTRFASTDIRAARVPTTLIEQLVPGLEVPIAGVITDGRARLDGALRAMQVQVDAVFDPAQHSAPAQVSARGGVGLGDTVRATDLRLAVDSLPVALLRQFVPELPLGGTVSGQATVNGSLARVLTGEMRLVHREGALVTRIAGGGRVALAGEGRVNLDLRLMPLELGVVEQFAPALDLRGSVSGVVRVRGTPTDLALRANLALPRGMVRADGRLLLSGARPVYAASLELRDVDLAAAAPALPTTRLSGAARVAGEGVEPATMEAQVAARFADAIVDSMAFTDVRAAAALENGLLRVDTLRLDTDFGGAVASGTFGVTPSRIGVLAYDVTIDSLSGLERWLATGDTTVVAPRPGRSAGVSGIPRDSIAGSLRTTGELTGNVQGFSARGRATLDGVVWGGSSIDRGRVEYALLDARSPAPSLVVGAALDSLRAAGFALDSVRAQATYAEPSGELLVAIFPADTTRYLANAEFTVGAREGSVRLRDIELVLDSTTWVSAHPSRVTWGGRGIGIESLDLRAADREGRIVVDGHIPSEGSGTLAVSLDGVQLADWLAVLQTDVRAAGRVTFRGRVDGTLAQPVMRGAFAVTDATYQEVAFPALRGGFDYADRRLAVEAAAVRGRYELATASASLPIDLALADAGARFPGGPLTIDVEGDSIPLAPLGDVTEAIADVRGTAAGAVAVRGTVERPRLVGGLVTNLSSLGITPIGVTLRDVAGVLRMTGDSIVVDSLSARSGGVIRAAGTVNVAERSAPRADISVVAEDAKVLDNERGELFADARLHIEGTPSDLGVTGHATVQRGVIYIPEQTGERVMSLDNPAVLGVVDTARATQLDLAVVGPAPVRNLRVDVDLGVSRGTWVRSSDANVEVYGDLAVVLDREVDQMTLRGTLYTERGDYTFAGRRFVVTNGSVQFTGDPQINPQIQVQGRHEVRLAGRAPLEIQVLVGGTLHDPQVSLESDAQPPLSQSDLLAYLAFGRSATSLLQFPGSALQSGGESGARLVGNVAALATRQLATLALGALAEDVEDDVAAATGADVLNITPARLPAELTLDGVGVLLRGTEIEIGKYLNRRTFVAADVRPSLTFPGVRLDRSLSSQMRFRAVFESRFEPQMPTLTTGTRPETIRVLGATLTWSLGW